MQEPMVQVTSSELPTASPMSPAHGLIDAPPRTMGSNTPFGSRQAGGEASVARQAPPIAQPGSARDQVSLTQLALHC